MIKNYFSGNIQFEGDSILACLKRLPDGSIYIHPDSETNSLFPSVTIPENVIFDLLQPTMFALLEDITPGSPLMHEFLPEWNLFQELIAAPESEAYFTFGTWVYYPKQQHLVHFASQKWHKTALLVRNSSLLAPAGHPHNWVAGKKLLEENVLAVAGASVGSTIFHTVAMMHRPAVMKIADSKDYLINNANRIRLNYTEFNQNKAQVIAAQVQSVDPFSDIYTYSNGIDRQSLTTFLGGNPATGEPAATMVVEETDDPEAKLIIREEARKQRIPLVMVTDIGSAAQVDVRRFDKKHDLSLCYNYSDEKLYQVKQAWDLDAGDRNRLLDCIYAFSGKEESLSVQDIRQVVLQEIPVEFSGMPQLGATVSIAAGMAAWAITQIVLGFNVPERIHFNMKDQKLEIKGELL